MTTDRYTIVVVDDVPEVRNGISVILEAEGYDVRQASNGLEALQQVDETVDLVITDILMPEIDGIELCQKLKDAYPGLKLILISGGGRQPAIDSSYDYLEVAKKLTGVDTILKKPFNPEELLKMINSQLA